jgi:Lipid desaturase domain
MTQPSRMRSRDVERPSALVLVELFSVIAFTVLLAPLFLRLVAAITTPAAALVAAAGALIGYVAADVASGLVHWFCDRFLDEDTPLVGLLVIVPFREHHRDPRAMTRHGFLELSGNSCLAVAPLLALAWAAPLSLGADAAIAVFALAVLVTNLAHGWAHADHAPTLVRRLQGWGVLLRPADHQAHHAAVLVTPRFHHWHHAEHPEAVNRNFAVHAPWLDRLFGTAYLPAGRWPEAYGIAEHPVPEGYWRQLAWPLWRRP